MKHYNYFFRVDIFKKTVDVYLLHLQIVAHREFSNDSGGMSELLKWLKELNTNEDETIFCMEATGLYCFTLTHFLASKGISVWVEHNLTIKRATALARGKNDKLDSKRIAVYCAKNLEKIRLWKPMDSTLEKIKSLVSLRDRLVETQKRLITPIDKLADVCDIEMAKLLRKTIKKSTGAIEKDLKATEAKIIEVVNGDKNLKQL